jgi:hypothetical protein
VTRQESSQVGLPRYVPANEARVRRVSPQPTREGVPGASRIVHSYFGEPRETIPGPQSFLVHHAPGSTIRAHFHPVDQFQIFFPGEGSWYKSQPIESISLHYADAHVTYGPFGSGSEPFSFLTLRAISTAQTSYLPEDRHRLPPPPRLRRGNIQVGIPRQDPNAIVSIDGVTELIEGRSDGLEAHLIELQPNTRTRITQSAPSGGQYHCVLQGSLVFGDVEFSFQSVGWIPASVESVDVQSGGRGCAVVVVQFPGSPSTTKHAGRPGEAS